MTHSNQPRTILQSILAFFLLVLLGMLMLTFIGVGFVGGVVLASWQSIRDVRLEQLEYRQADTWKQHLEVYSSVCTVQRHDSIDFLLDKLKRLAYEENEQKFIKPSAVGQYSVAFDASGKNGRIGIYLRDFHFPRGDRLAYRVELTVRDGKIESIRNDDGDEILNFDLQPELINEIYNEGGEAREIIQLVKIPNNLLGAFLAVEDKRFYAHWGVDLQGILRASIHNVRLYLGQVKGTAQGASTITQQLTRNIYLSPERRILRKIKEALLATRIESGFSKDEILERYLNLINLGRYGSRDVLGVQEAAKSYFGKPVWELEIHECATLAGIPKSPTRYSPVRYPERSKERRDLVLGLMRRAGYITQAEYETSVKQPLVVEVPESTQSKEAPNFLDYIHNQLTRIPDLEGRLYNHGLKVYTTIDMSMQKVAESVVADHLRTLDKDLSGSPDYRGLPDYDENRNNPGGIDPIANYLQAGLVAVEPQTGHVKAMVGGRDYFMPRWFRDRGIPGNFFNRAVQAQRQPGSAFKPIVFAAMLNYPPLATPATVIRDEPWFTEGEPGKRWAPRNYGGGYEGEVTLRRALEKSINIASARLMWETPKGKGNRPEGLNRTLALAKRMGIQSPLPPYPSLALGSADLTLIELTAAYATFANKGVRTTPISIQYVEDRNEEILVENQVEREQVLDENIAYLMTHLMAGVIQNGTGRRARLMGLKRPAAGKTGTTNDYTDAWFVGYIQNLAVGVWVGFDDPQKSTKREGARAALPIWARFMLDGARGPVTDFHVPSGIVFREIDKTTGLLKYEGKCPDEDIIREAFLVGYEPKMLCDAHE
ncbi:MAG: PBP1A family penicillin-binding protein [Candidatus Poribacteria bacterium]|nr:PBP1A family penicillin-binding protein [Candidatus Poribacteria bacterium]